MLVIIAVCILLNVIVAFFVESKFNATKTIQRGRAGHNISHSFLAFVTQLRLVDAENESSTSKPFLRDISASTNSDMTTRIAPIAHSWLFDASDLKKRTVRSSSCPTSGETTEFDVIRREGFDEIMESVANDDDKQFEDFARSFLDALELVSTLTPDRYVYLPHCNIRETIIFVDIF
jgi:hypothetical protein